MKLRFFLIFLLFLLSRQDTFAQGFSYIYIQGDKKTPIYTKIEGVMLPRHGKNYALISRLAPGPLSVEILFQQNEYPPLLFNIMVPENGKRAFVLENKGGVFSLFDIQQNFYLKANNDITDDHLPTVITNAAVANKNPENSTPPVELEETREAEQKVIAATEEKQNAPAITETTVAADSSKPQFIDNITFDNDPASMGSSNTDLTSTENSADNSSSVSIINSDCTGIISAANFQLLKNTINTKKTEDERLGIILETTKKNCFSTEQSKLLLEKLDSDIAKFSAAKKLYPKITDQVNFRELESLFSADEWKENFRTFLKPE